MRKEKFIVVALVLVVVVGRVAAQTPPCGKAIVRTEGPKDDERFVAAPPEQVKTAVLKAIPAVAAKVHKDEGFHLETEFDSGVAQAIAQTNKDSGLRAKRGGLGAMGKIIVDIKEATQDGQKGSLLHIEFHHNAFVGRVGKEGYAQPLAEETVCLVKLLSTNEPAKNPRGLETNDKVPSRTVALPDDTPLKVLLRAPFFSKKAGEGQTVQFEVAEDVVVDDVALVRRGALATAHLSEVKRAKGYGRHGEIAFAFDAVTAADGQTIPITGASEKARGGRHNEVMASVMMSPSLGWLIKGAEVFIRAGTSYDVHTSGQHMVQSGH